MKDILISTRILNYKYYSAYIQHTLNNIRLANCLAYIVENSTQVWNPHHIQNIDIIENVQRRFTIFVPGLFNVPYLTRLETLNLKSLEERRIINDIIFIFKIIRNLVDLPFNKYFSFNTSNTRGHSMKLNFNYSRLACRRYYFSTRCIDV